MKQLLFITVLLIFISCTQYSNEPKETKIEAKNPALDSALVAINTVLDYHTTNIKFDVKWITNSLRLVGDMAYHDATVAYTINSLGNAPVNITAEAMMVWKKTGATQWKAHTVGTVCPLNSFL